MVILAYVDDILLAKNDTEACKKVKTYLIACFSIKDPCLLKYFSGIEVACGPQELSLCQRK